MTNFEIFSFKSQPDFQWGANMNNVDPINCLQRVGYLDINDNKYGFSYLFLIMKITCQTDDNPSNITRTMSI